MTTRLLEWQPLVTIYKKDNYDIIQHESQWLDTRGATSTRIIVYLLSATGGTPNLVVQMSDALGGPWTDASTITTSSNTPTEVLFSRELPRNESDYLQRFLRWKVTGVNGDGVCFRIRVEIM